MSYTGFGSSEGASEGDNEMVVERGEEYDEEYREDRERSGWEFDRSDFGVHSRGLFDREGGELSEAGVEDYGACEDWEEF